MVIKAWYIGNTTIRNAKRLKEGLRVLVNSPLHGNLVGRANEQEFAKLLHENGVVFVQRIDATEDADVSDVGRKWRAALMQLGFIKPAHADRPFTVTPNGIRLINAQTLPSEQEVFLRALLAHQIPSEIEDFPEPIFSPLRIVLEILNALEAKNLDPVISKDEMASIVQLVRRVEDVGVAVSNIEEYRNQLSLFTVARDKRRFVNQYRDEVASHIQSQSGGTLKDYSDSNFRYLKLTGLFKENASRLLYAEHKRTLINQILSEPYTPANQEEYLDKLWSGAALPTDNAPKAIEVIQSTVELLELSGEQVSIPTLEQLEIQDLSQVRFDLEDSWLKVLEKRYAERQVHEYQDILSYLRALTLPNRGRGLVPQGEAPAYFEWILWRSFLAINSLANKPWEARRFRIDEEFCPLGPAPGGGPDLIFEFEDFVLVVEVTLTASSRQEAAEGEPVRRHVAQLSDEYREAGKPVYCLFIANSIDTNTAETFRTGIWYRPNDSRMSLDIVPITLTQFADLFEAGFKDGNRMLEYSLFEQLIKYCRQNCESSEAPLWKETISRHVDDVIRTLQIS